MENKTPNIIVLALYKFVKLQDYAKLKTGLLDFCKKNGIKGTLLLASEGINGTVAGTRGAIDNLKNYLARDPRLEHINFKESLHSTKPFLRTKVKLKKEIVTLGVEDINPEQQAGQYVVPAAWNKLISDPDTLVIDTRNDYEVEIGSFANAINPKTQSFSEFPQYFTENLAHINKNQKIAMFCTGGIRCEKSTAFLTQQGFNNVYHLQGGILKYLEEVPATNSLWQGECFVFDDRVAVKHDLAKGNYEQCHGCRYPITAEDMASANYKAGVYCPRCYFEITEDKIQRSSERQKQMTLAKMRGVQHLGQTNE